MPPKPKSNQILLVDDTEANRYTLSHYLTRAGYSVTEAASGDEAFKHASKAPDLIILDVQLPDISGYEVSRLLRQNPKTRHIPILQISATFTMSSDKVRGLDAGADGYLTGPVQPEELLANVRMLLRLKTAQDALAASNERLQSVLSTILDVYFVLDFSLNFLELNSAAERLFGKSASELTGKSLLPQVPEPQGATLRAHLHKAAQDRKTTHFETESAIKPGVWWEAHIYPREERMEVYLRDITERKTSEKKLHEAAAKLRTHVEELEKAHRDLGAARDQLRSQNEQLEQRVRERTAKLQETIDDLETFSYSITHDMRAPLRAMQGFARLLAEANTEKLDEQSLDYLDRIANSANRLDLLIRDVLSYSNIVRTPLQLVPVDADKLAREIINDYPGLRPPAAQVTISGKLPVVMANEAFLTQCFSNLLGNAVKFVPPNTIPHVQVTAERQHQQVRIAFRDNGIGIAPQHQGRLFTLFHRGHSDFPGTGVGLAVVRKAVERMGGSVGLESAPGQGSTFWLNLHAAD